MKKRLAEEVYLGLRQEIFNAQYDPNQLIVEADVAAKYGVSRATAREALHRLCSEGHLTSYPRSGYMVKMLSPLEQQQIKRMRLALESLVVEILCAEATDDQIEELYVITEAKGGGDVKFATLNTKFHLGMAELTNDKYLISALTNLLGALSRVDVLISPERYQNWQRYHRNILDSLLARDVEGAKKWLASDLEQ